MTIALKDLVKIAEENDHGTPPSPGTVVVLVRHEGGGIEIYNKSSLFSGYSILESVTLDTPEGTKITLEHLTNTKKFWELLEKTPPTGGKFCLTVIHWPNGVSYAYRYVLRCNPSSYEITHANEDPNGENGETLIRIMMVVLQSEGMYITKDHPKHPGHLSKGSSKIEGQEQEAFVKKVLHSKYLEDAVDGNASVVKPVPKGQLEPAKSAKLKPYPDPVEDIKILTKEELDLMAKHKILAEMQFEQKQQVQKALLTGQEMAYSFVDEIAKITEKLKLGAKDEDPAEVVEKIMEIKSTQLTAAQEQVKKKQLQLLQLLGGPAPPGFENIWSSLHSDLEEEPVPEQKETKPEKPKGRKVILD